MLEMELGAQLPAWQWAYDVGELRAWVEATEELGYDWLGMPDHIFYAYETPSRPSGAYPGGTIQHEAFTFLSWVAAFTSRIALTTSVIVLPQRQAPVVAKQAIEIDVLSGGRLRLGVGVGWQAAEFDGLGKDFTDRGKRVEDDIATIRACWAGEPIDHQSPTESLVALSMLPKPTRPAGPPIFYGGDAPAGIDRTARLCDGWIAFTRFKPDEAGALVEKMHAALIEHGRDPATFPLQATTPLVRDLDTVASILRTYRDAGFNSLGVHLPSYNPADRITVDEYVARLRVLREEVWPSLT